MIALFEVARYVQDFCQQQRWLFCFIGGLALQRWGEPRVTQDVDVTILTGFGNEASYIHTLLQRFEPRIEHAERFALRNRVLLLQSGTEIGIDVALGGLEFEETVIQRATFYEYLPDIRLLTCSAEDLIVYKAFAARSRDWTDIEGILMRQRENLDWDYIQAQLQPLVLLKEEPEIWGTLEKLRNNLA
jgi:hypothetical protein